MTKEEIEAEVEQMAEGRTWVPHFRPSVIAFMEHTNGLSVDQKCPYCDGAMWVEDFEGRAWTVRCPCGKTDNSFRGL
jgi:hypothetical protein